MNSNTRRTIFLCRELMSARLREKFVGDSAGCGLPPTADICEEFGRAERNIDTRRHWKKRTGLSGVYIFVSVLVRDSCYNVLYAYSPHVCSLVKIENACVRLGLVFASGTCKSMRKEHHHQYFVNDAVKPSRFFLSDCTHKCGAPAWNWVVSICILKSDPVESGRAPARGS